jgi:Bacterial-like globin
MRLNFLFALGLAALASAGATACGDDDAADGGGGGADAGGGGADAGGGAGCSAEMFEKYGVDAFLAVNDSIIEKSVAAPTSAVGTSFQDLAAAGADRVEEFTTNLANFLVQVYGGPENYTGPSMEDAHEGLDITSEQYDYFIANIVVPALSENGVPQSDIEDCFAPPVVDPAFKNSIINR